MGEAKGLHRVEPASHSEAADLMRTCAGEGASLRPVGSGTKLRWGRTTPDPDFELSTDSLNRVLEHNAGDFTAVLQPGVKLAEAQQVLADKDQMLALDPPLQDSAATLGGIVATGDSGPLRHRFNAPRDLILGITVVLSDGTVARAGGQVIKNVAGYDLGKLFAGSFGTLGLILELTVRLHPLPPGTATATAEADDPGALERAASALAHAQIETNSLDLAWASGRGRVLARFGGAEPAKQAEAAQRVIEDEGLDPLLVEDDAGLWDRQRAGQRSEGGLVVRVAGLQTEAARVIRAAEALGGSVVGRAGLGLYWVKLEHAGGAEAVTAVNRLRSDLAPLQCVVLDAPAGARAGMDPWGWAEGDDGALTLMRSVKGRFDPAGVCNPGIFVGGI